ncbi:hypothetical protein LJC47_00285, partial [Desulfosarcina sp. OttesenSCG-928-B08]|nr:hypothetical protein [Desulfosarcina sp. OttesenSCG-928-B08]
MDAVWLLPPDWKSAPRVTDAWKTGVNITPLGNEARSALIAYPRLTLSYSAKILSYRHRAWLMRSLFKHLHKVWGVPVWTDVTLLTVPAAAGDTRITVANTVLRRFHAGGKLVLIDAADDLHHAACTIADVEDGAITLSEPVSEDWPAAYVYPLVTAQMSATQNITSITSHYA